MMYYHYAIETDPTTNYYIGVEYRVSDRVLWVIFNKFMYLFVYLFVYLSLWTMSYYFDFKHLVFLLSSHRIIWYHVY